MESTKCTLSKVNDSDPDKAIAEHNFGVESTSSIAAISTTHDTQSKATDNLPGEVDEEDKMQTGDASNLKVTKRSRRRKSLNLYHTTSNISMRRLVESFKILIDRNSTTISII